MTIIHTVITLWRTSTVIGETKGKRVLKVTQIIARQKKVRQRVSWTYFLCEAQEKIKIKDRLHKYCQTTDCWNYCSLYLFPRMLAPCKKCTNWWRYALLLAHIENYGQIILAVSCTAEQVRISEQVSWGNSMLPTQNTGSL